jgi:acyl-homoserine lactone acylase PvdQ
MEGRVASNGRATGLWGAALVIAVALVLPSGAGAAKRKDYSATALNIIPSGQYGAIPPPPGADTQAQMYDGLTPLFDNVTNPDLTKYFKSEKFGVSTAGPGTTEAVPRAGVQIVRDEYDVPHVTATTHAGGVWAAGWIAAEDRGALLQEARYNARVAAIDAPGLDAVNLISNLQTFQPSQQTESVVAKQARVLRQAGPEGKAVLRDIDPFVSGINAYFDAHGSTAAPFTRNDIFAFNALKDQFVGEGGGDEARRSQFLGGLEERLGVRKGYSVFDDLRQNIVKGNPTTVDGHFRYEHAPRKPGAPGSVVLDPGSFSPASSVSAAALRGVDNSPTERPQASNELLVDAQHSTTGHPLLVGGPQIGYFYPGFTYEIDMHAPGLDWRGATSTPFPGYLLIGRGPDFATTLTSAGADQIDQFAEKLCDHSNTKYRYKGKCRSMHQFNAGTLAGDPVRFKTTVHGPVVGYATVHGRKVAISRQRSSYGKDSLDLLFNRRLSNGRVHSAKSFFHAASLTPQTFNSFYIDKKHIAMFTSGLLPKRAKGTDPSLPTLGTGHYEWHGFLPPRRHPHGIDPSNTPVGGTMVNWNNISAHGFGAADDEWNGNGSAQRVDMLNQELRKQRNKHGKWSLSDVTSAMNAAATQDLRAIDTVPLLAKLLRGSTPPNQQSGRMLSLLKQWRHSGGSRLDRNGDGKIDDPGAAIMDAAWPKIADALMRPQLGPQLDELNSIFTRFNGPPSGQNVGWYMYFDRDIRRLLGMKQPQPMNNRYCGHGNLAKCRNSIWRAIAAAGRELTNAQGTSNPSAWRADANAERIEFVPGLLKTTMRYTNRPSGIQQVISFNRHR